MIPIILNTFREAIAKKIFIGYYIIYTIIILVFLFAVNLETVEGVISLTDVEQSVISLQAIMTSVLSAPWKTSATPTPAKNTATFLFECGQGLRTLLKCLE